MFKYLLSFLTFASIALGSITITSSVISDGYLYDLDVQFDFNKYIDAYAFLNGNPTLDADEGTKIWYETMTFKPSEDGWYTFDNYNSDIAVGNTIIEETQLLFYTDVPEGDYIIDMPTAFRYNNNYGFGLGNDGTEWPEGEVTPDGFYGEMQLTGGTEYIIVFSSFVPDAYGTLDVSILGNNPAAFGVVPEPSTYSLFIGFCVFMYVAIRKRNASKKDIRRL
jgi:hypothetical protein